MNPPGPATTAPCPVFAPFFWREGGKAQLSKQLFIREHIDWPSLVAAGMNPRPISHKNTVPRFALSFWRKAGKHYPNNPLHRERSAVESKDLFLATSGAKREAVRRRTTKAHDYIQRSMKYGEMLLLRALHLSVDTCANSAPYTAAYVSGAAYHHFPRAYGRGDSHLCLRPDPRSRNSPSSPTNRQAQQWRGDRRAASCDL